MCNISLGKKKLLARKVSENLGGASPWTVFIYSALELRDGKKLTK